MPTVICCNREKIFNRIRRLISPPEKAALKRPSAIPARLPTLWLLGKTGAGKSSLIQEITGRSDVEIGNGFSPCTRSSRRYDFPSGKPLLRFLDTRGLAETDYNADEDIAACVQATSAAIVVMKAEEPEQSEVIRALERIRRSGAVKHLLLVHTGILVLDDALQQNNPVTIFGTNASACCCPGLACADSGYVRTDCPDRLWLYSALCCFAGILCSPDHGIKLDTAATFPWHFAPAGRGTGNRFRRLG